MTAARLAMAAICAALTACGGGCSPALAPTSAPTSQRAAHVALFVGDSTPDLVTGIATIDAAVSGSTSCAADLDLIRSTRAAVVVVNYAINDSVALTDAQYVECMGRIAQAASDAGSALLLVDVNPIVPGGSQSSHHDNREVRRIEALKVQIAMQHGAYYCIQPALQWSLDLVPDGVHPGPLAKPAIAAAISRCISEALR